MQANSPMLKDRKNGLEQPHTTRFPSYDGSDRMRYVTTGRHRGSWQMTAIPSDY